MSEKDGGYLIPVGDDDLYTAMKAKMEQGIDNAKSDDKMAKGIGVGCAIVAGIVFFVLFIGACAILLW